MQLSTAEDVVTLTSSLVQCDTCNPPGGELAAAELVAAFLAGQDVETEVRPLEAGRANVVARVPGSGGPGLLLCGHLDTVPAGEQPWVHDPHSGLLTDGQIHGRGTTDMKGAIAAMALVMAGCARRTKPPSGDLVLALTAGEEVDSCGARRLVEEGVLEGIDSVIIGEPTGMKVGVGHKGALWVNVEMAGLAAHGARPQDGINSVRLMLDWINATPSIEALIEAQPHPLLGSPTISLNLLSGGTAPNMVPASCRAVLDFRTIPGQPHDRLLDALSVREPRATVSVLRDSAPVLAAPEAELVRIAQEVVAELDGADVQPRGMPYLTDGSVFTEASDATIVILGPGDERLAHAPDEHLPLAQLHLAVSCYERITARLLYA
jgi:succinyl-diaminopimelate desuccinylase